MSGCVLEILVMEAAHDDRRRSRKQKCAVTGVPGIKISMFLVMARAAAKDRYGR